MNLDATPCQRLREELSASRDRAGALDRCDDHHLATCPDCREWMAASDHACRVVRLRTPSGPSLVASALAAWDHHRAEHLVHRQHRGRLLLAGAAAGCIGVAILLATNDSLHTHLGQRAARELVLVELAIAVGLACAAWRPARFLTGLVPMLTLVTSLKIVFSVTDLVAGRLSTLAELSHLPFIVGLAGALLCRTHLRLRPVDEQPSPVTGLGA